MRFSGLRYWFTISTLMMMPSVVMAQGWPARPVTIVVPYAAGTSPDIIGRLVAQALSEKLGQRFIVENRVGASGNIGAQSVARSQPNGYTLLLGTPNPVGFNKLMEANLQFDPEKDFVPIVTVGKSPQIFVTGPKSKAKTLPELMALAKAKPGELTAGIPGTGTSGHIAIEALLDRSGGKMTMVPYRGAPPVIDVLNGEIDIGVGLVPTYVGQVNANQITALAVTSSQRSEQLPNVPTAAESGFPGFELTAWYMLVGPTGTPDDVIEKINKAVNDYMHSDKGKQQYGQLDVQVAGGTAKEAKDFIASEITKWGPIIKKANIQM